MKHRGLFISFEGAEGVGKSTQISLLEKTLLNEGYSVYRTHEPGGTPLGDELRRLFKSHEMDPMTELFIIEACRAEHVRKVILPRLKKGEIILCDRFSESSLVYQGILGKLPLKFIREMNRYATGGLKSDLCIWLDLPIKEVKKRLESRGPTQDRFDSQPESFHVRILKAYKKLAQKKWPPRLISFNAAQSPESLHEEIFRVVKKKLKAKKK